MNAAARISARAQSGHGIMETISEIRISEIRNKPKCANVSEEIRNRLFGSLQILSLGNCHELRISNLEFVVTMSCCPGEMILDTASGMNPVSNPNRATLYDLRSQTAAVNQSPHGPFNG